MQCSECHSSSEFTCQCTVPHDSSCWRGLSINIYHQICIYRGSSMPLVTSIRYFDSQAPFDACRPFQFSWIHEFTALHATRLQHGTLQLLLHCVHRTSLPSIGSGLICIVPLLLECSLLEQCRCFGATKHGCSHGHACINGFPIMCYCRLLARKQQLHLLGWSIVYVTVNT